MVNARVWMLGWSHTNIQKNSKNFRIKEMKFSSLWWSQQQETSHFLFLSYTIFFVFIVAKSKYSNLSFQILYYVVIFAICTSLYTIFWILTCVFGCWLFFVFELVSFFSYGCYSLFSIFVSCGCVDIFQKKKKFSCHFSFLLKILST